MLSIGHYGLKDICQVNELKQKSMGYDYYYLFVYSTSSPQKKKKEINKNLWTSLKTLKYCVIIIWNLPCIQTR